MMKIPLTKGKFALVDNDDIERIFKHSWCMHTHGYAQCRSNKKILLMHRFIMGAKPGQVIDHINGNKLDNRKKNLRFCTMSQNFANRPITISNSTGYKGVDWREERKKFRARIRINYKNIFLGYFDTAEEAAKRYNREAKRLFGEFALLNKVEAT